MNELNPNHPVTVDIREQWYKFCAIMLFKSGQTQVTITAEDIERFSKSDLANIVCRIKNETIILQLVSHAEAQRLARTEGGLPV